MVMRIVAAATAVLVAAGCQSERDTGRGGESSQTMVQKLLSERSSDLEKGAVARYLKPVGRDALDVEKTIARGAIKAKLGTIEVVIQQGFVHPRKPELDRVRVDFTYLHKPLPDDNVFRFRIIYKVRRQGAEWRISDAEIDARDFPIVPPWATGPIETARSPHFLALFRPGLRDIEKILKMAERARKELLPKVTLPLDDVHLMVLARDGQEFGEFTGSPGAGAVAIAYRQYNPRGGLTDHPENREMIVNMGEVFSLGLVPHEHQEVMPRQVFQHELGHLALSRYDRFTTPSWVKEGGAMFLSGERRLVAWKAGTEEGVFNRMEFAEFSGDGSLDGALYPYVNAAVSYLTETYGTRRFWKFYRGFTNFRPGGAMRGAAIRQVRADRTRRLLGIHYDISPEELDRRTRAYIKRAVAQAG